MLVQRQHVKRIEGVRDVGELDGEAVDLAHREVAEGNLVGLGDEGRTFENLALHDLVLGEVVAVPLLGSLHIQLFLGGELSRADDAVAALVVLGLVHYATYSTKFKVSSVAHVVGQVDHGAQLLLVAVEVALVDVHSSHARLLFAHQPLESPGLDLKLFQVDVERELRATHIDVRLAAPRRLLFGVVENALAKLPILLRGVLWLFLLSWLLQLFEETRIAIEVACIDSSRILFEDGSLLIQELTNLRVNFGLIFVVHAMVVLLVDGVSSKRSRNVALCIERVSLDLQRNGVVHRLD